MMVQVVSEASGWLTSEALARVQHVLASKFQANMEVPGSLVPDASDPGAVYPMET